MWPIPFQFFSFFITRCNAIAFILTCTNTIAPKYLREKLNFLLQHISQDHSKVKIVVPEEPNYGT